MNRTLFTAIALGLAPGLVACGDKDDEGDDTGADTAADGDDGEDGGTSAAFSEVDCSSATVAHEVDVVDFAYEPSYLSVSTGDVIRWTNGGEVDHTVTSGIPDAGNEGQDFDSGTLAPGDDYCLEVTEDASGDTTCFCTLHPDQMRDALITVM